MFQAQKKTINSTLKVAVSFKIIMTTSVTIKTVFHNTTPYLQDQDYSVQDQDQDQDQDRFFGLTSVLSYTTDGLRPHH